MHGHVVREYTMLLDPPVYTPAQPSVAGAAVSAPTTGTGPREGDIERSSEAPPAATSSEAAAIPTPAPAATPPSPAPTTAANPAAAPTETATAAAAPEPAPVASTAPAPTANRSLPSAEENSTHLVHRGETLSRIAAGVAGEAAHSARARSWMLAIYQANPRAFDKNMNVMRSGAVLRIPDATTATAISPREANVEIRRQYAAWRGSSGAPTASAGGTQPGRLRLVTPSEGASVATSPGAEREAQALQGRVHELEGQLAESKNQLAESKRLLELKNADLARMQAQLAAKASQPPPRAPTPEAVRPPPAPPPAPAPAPTPPATAAPPPVATAPPPVNVPPPTAEVEKAQPAPASKPTPPPAAGGSLFDTLMDYWWAGAVVVLALVVFAVVRVVRARRGPQFDDSLGRLAVAGMGAGEGASRGFASSFGAGPSLGSAAAPGTGNLVRGLAAATAEPSVRAAPAPVPEAAFLVEETGTHERPRFSAAPAPAAPPKHVASDETISSETAINLDQGDPLAEADFHMAYGLYDQAADLIRIAIAREPERRDLKLKLLEVFFVWGNKDQFLQTARELADTRTEAAPGEFEKILIMGKQLAPEDALFSGAGPVAGAAAGGVDLDLEGGQSRVDFELLNEPSGADGQGVDLDLGATLAERDSATAATTRDTDRNVALESTFTSTTGTTRQMTARVRQDGASTAEMEGPTVEQPAMAGAHQPTVRQKVETALRKASMEPTAELALDDLGLDIGGTTVDRLSPAAPGEGPTLVAGVDEESRRTLEETQGRGLKESGSATGQWQFDQNELEAALTQTSIALTDVTVSGRLAALKGHELDVDVGDATGRHAATSTDFDVGGGGGAQPPASASGLDLDVGTASVPESAFAATQRLSSEELALPDIEPVTMSEVGTKLDLARAYMDMGDPDGARNILEEVLNEGSAAQKQEAQRLMESLPG